MDFEIYCDESKPDLFTTKKGDKHNYLLIGSLWLEAGLRNEIKQKINEIRQKHSVITEFKWSKIAKGKRDFYFDLVDLFFSYGLNLRFRAIAVCANDVSMDFHAGDGELGFYKFYYQLLHHWILDFNSYRVFCDVKTNRDLNRLAELKTVLNNANLSSEIEQIQFLHSYQVDLIQFTDVLLGMVGGRLNGTITKGGIKDQVIKRLEGHLDISRLVPTPRGERKFNIFRIQLQGGW